MEDAEQGGGGRGQDVALLLLLFQHPVLVKIVHLNIILPRRVSSVAGYLMGKAQPAAKVMRIRAKHKHMSHSLLLDTLRLKRIQKKMKLNGL